MKKQLLTVALALMLMTMPSMSTIMYTGILR